MSNENDGQGGKAMKALLEGKAIRNVGQDPGKFYVLADDGYICDETGGFGEEIDFWASFEILAGKVQAVERPLDDSGFTTVGYVIIPI